MYKLFLTIRYLRKRRIAWFAVAAVMLCVAMVLIVMSVMGGFLDMVKTRARGLLGDVVIDNRRYQGFPLYQEFIDHIRGWPEVAAATPVIYTYGLLRFPSTDALAMVSVVGIRLREVFEVNAFRQSLYYERHYPGTTSLGLVQQPLLGQTEDGRIVLPAEYQAALERSRAERSAGDDDSVETPLNEILVAGGHAPIPGVYAFNVETGAPALAGEPWPGLIIGRDIVARREPDGRYTRYSMYPRGCIVTLSLSRAAVGGGLDDVPVKQPCRYVDDSRTGIYEIDSRHVYCDFDLLQRLLQMGVAERAEGSGTSPARCSQIQIKLAPGVDARAMTSRLQAAYHALLEDPRLDLDPAERSLVQAVEALTWEQSQAHVIQPVEKERHLVSILFGIISLVAVVLVLCILYMIALQKTRDIGIIKSIGGSSTGVACVFLMYGAAVGAVGAALGSVLGYFFVRYINEIQALLTRMNPSWQVWDRSVYSFDEIPSRVDPADLIGVALSAVVASTLGSVVAAWRAGTMEPVEALRYE